MDAYHTDWLMVFVAAILNMVISYFWFSKWLFGPAWHKLCDLKEKDKKCKKGCIAKEFVVSLVIAYFLSFFEANLGVTTVTDGMLVGFCIWLGFVATTQISSIIYCKKPFKLFAIKTGYKLVSFLVMSGVIGA